MVDYHLSMVGISSFVYSVSGVSDMSGYQTLLHVVYLFYLVHHLVHLSMVGGLEQPGAEQTKEREAQTDKDVLDHNHHNHHNKQSSS